MSTMVFQEYVRNIVANEVAIDGYDITFPRTPDKKNLGVLRIPIRKATEVDDEINYWWEDLAQVFGAALEYVHPPSNSRRKMTKIIFHIRDLA